MASLFCGVSVVDLALLGAVELLAGLALLASAGLAWRAV